MGIGFRPKNKWISGIILGVLCCGMLFAEFHGIVGHTHSFPGQESRSYQRSNSSGLQITSLERAEDDSSCVICLCSRLLSHSLIPQVGCPVDTSYAMQAIPVHSLGATQGYSLRTGNRSPPLA